MWRHLVRQTPCVRYGTLSDSSFMSLDNCFALYYISGCKAVGYKLGEKYYKLPKKLISFCTMNKKYWQE